MISMNDIASSFRTAPIEEASRVNLFNLIAAFLSKRGLEDFSVSQHGQYGMTGPEVRLATPNAYASKVMIEACEDAMIKRGGAGYGFCQIAPEGFSDPSTRARRLLMDFELQGKIDMSRDHGLVFDADLNLVTRNGHVAYASDELTKKLASWVKIQMQHH